MLNVTKKVGEKIHFSYELKNEGNVDLVIKTFPILVSDNVNVGVKYRVIDYEVREFTLADLGFSLIISPFKISSLAKNIIVPLPKGGDLIVGTPLVATLIAKPPYPSTTLKVNETKRFSFNIKVDENFEKMFPNGARIGIIVSTHDDYKWHPDDAVFVVENVIIKVKKEEEEIEILEFEVE